MIFVTVTELKTYLVGYLNQRKAAYAVVGNIGSVRRVEMLIKRFDLINKMPLTRHCFEVCKCWDLLISTLPSKTGRHAGIRNRMLEFMNECKKINRDTYEKRSSGQQMHIWETQKSNHLFGQNKS